MQGHYDELVGVEATNRPILLMEEERHRLARELHDDLLQTLSAVGLRLELCRQLSRSNKSSALEVELARLKTCLEESVTIMRHLVVESPSLLADGESLGKAIECFAREYERETGIVVTLDLGRLPEDKMCREQRAAVLRIVQEALRNTSRHSQASRVQIRAADETETLRVSIEDDGDGFHLPRVTAGYPHQGLGIAGMRERAWAVGGQLVIESEPGRGTSMALSLPLRGSKEWTPSTSSGPAAEV